MIVPRPQDQRSRRWLGLPAVLATVVVLLSLTTGCGLPGPTEVRTVDSAAVPYRLLDSEPWSRPGEVGGPVPAGAPVVFWLTAAGQLAPTAVDASCSDRSGDVVEQLVALLTAPPDEEARSAGRSSAIPPSTELDLVEVVDGVAVVALEAASSLTADRLPLAVGQLVLTVTSAPEIAAVRVSTAGDLVEVPLPGGALTPRPVTADDYASLLPDRYRDRVRPDTVSAELGCTTSSAGGR